MQVKKFGLALGIAICWALISLVVYRAWIRGADHRDFYPRWAGARLLFQGHDLYSLETTRLIQVKLYGQELPPGVDQQAFAYPALIVVELLPFWLLPDVEIAAAAWAGTSIVLIYTTISLLYAQARASGIQQPLWAAALLPVWHYSAVMLFQVQFTALPLAALGIGYWAWRRGRDGLAGFVLAWGWIKPELIVLPVIWFILAAWRERRWSFLIFLVAGPAQCTPGVHDEHSHGDAAPAADALLESGPTPAAAVPGMAGARFLAERRGVVGGVAHAAGYWRSRLVAGAECAAAAAGSLCRRPGGIIRIPTRARCAPPRELFWQGLSRP